jgi:IclR family acetate operon transcriptional repressor
MSTSATLNKGLDILELLAERGELRVPQIVEALNVSRATAFRLISALQDRGYVEHSDTAKTYRLAPKVFALASASRTTSLTNLAAPAMQELRSLTGETINLGVLRRDRIVYEDILDGSFSLQLSARVGDLAPAHATAIGKAILAAIDPARRERLLPPEPYEAFTEHTITTYAELELELDRTARRGYAIDDQETELGACCLATPILAPDEQPVGGLSISGITARIQQADIPDLGRQLADRTRAISEHLAADAKPSAATVA